MVVEGSEQNRDGHAVPCRTLPCLYETPSLKRTGRTTKSTKYSKASGLVLEAIVRVDRSVTKMRISQRESARNFARAKP
jgi:hypothetical protein